VTAAVEAAPAVQTDLDVPLAGWGRTPRTVGTVTRPGSADDVLCALARPGRAVARGMGRSYGDAAQCSGGLTIDVTGLDAVGQVDVETGTIDVEGGATLHEVMKRTLPAGWFVAVTPGTRYVSIGGAIAADVHGKNHHVDGSFSRHVLEMTVVTPTGTVTVSPETDPELFWATAGGMGLTGVVVRARLRLIPVETSWMQVATKTFSGQTGLAGLMSAMEDTDRHHRYSVAWLDCLGRRRRAVLTQGDHAPLAAIPARSRERSRYAPRDPALHVPAPAPFRLANRVSVRALNEAWFRAARPSSGSLRTLTGFFHPLDAVQGWNLLYGPDGFVQYQFVVPMARGDVVENAVAAIASSGVPSLLAVLKRFGPASPGALSFPREGWTLALDFPLGPTQLPALLDELDQLVADAGGCVYLAKDARLRPELVPVMYSRLHEFRAVCRRVDPDGVLASDLSRRLGILR
jgi:decaprenylphospho-beta-D-ribofuranose 2-oxidase